MINKDEDKGGVCVQASGPLPHGAPADLAVRISALQQGPQPLVDLFNQYAAPYHQWELCLYLVHASDGVDMSYVQQLWDLYLKQVGFHPLHLVLLGSGCPLDAAAALPACIMPGLAKVIFPPQFLDSCFAKVVNSCWQHLDTESCELTYIPLIHEICHIFQRGRSSSACTQDSRDACAYGIPQTSGLLACCVVYPHPPP